MKSLGSLRLYVANRQLFLTVVVAVAIVTAALGYPSPIDAQSPQPGAYSVATIKPTTSEDDSQAIVSYPGGRFVAKGMTLKDLIEAAYGIRFGSENQVSGGPAWVNSLRFDIEAKPDQPTPIDGPYSHYGPQLQALLADRFGLKIHHESRQVPVFRLEVAANGSKLTPSPEAPPPSTEGAPHPGYSLSAPQGEDSRRSRMLGPGHVIDRGVTMKDLAEGLLQFQPEIRGRTVIDVTGLAGKYDFELQWTPQGTDPTPSGTQKDDVWPSLFTALRDQLGLKVVPGTGSNDVIVIDSATKPSAN